jgi:hypothetical protein
MSSRVRGRCPGGTARSSVQFTLPRRRG